MPVRRVTLQTIADRVGVSRMTVSNAFSRPDQLSGDLRQRILDTAEQLDYAGPDPAARALARGTTGSVGVLLTDSVAHAFADDVAARFLGAIADELGPTGLGLTLFTTVEAGGVVPARDIAVDGALVFACDSTSVSVDWLRRRRLPMVFVDQQPEPGVPSVNIDDRGGARAAARHLLELGHHRFGLLSPDGPHPAHQRQLGWRDELDQAGAEVTLLNVGHPPDEHDGAVTALLAGTHRPTALLCYSDAVAFAAIRAAEALGLRVPTDLSVIGFDDGPLAQRLRPPLTTVHQDVAAKGRAAAAALVAALDRRTADTTRRRARHVLLPTELVVRATTAPAPLR